MLEAKLGTFWISEIKQAIKLCFSVVHLQNLGRQCFSQSQAR